MYNKEIATLIESSKVKTAYRENNNLRYILMPMLGGLFVTLGTMLSYVIGAIMHHGGSGYYKIAMGLAFGIALNLVALAGGDLFTSNSMIVTIGALEKGIKWSNGIKLLVFSWIGNLIGSLFGAFLFVKSGVISGTTGYIGEFIVDTAATKMSIAPVELVIRAILCNVLVCLSIWISYKLKEETAKIIMITWCVFIFITAGFEHSVANMGLFSMALMLPHSALTVNMTGFIYNVSLATIGNFIGGGIVLGLPYVLISRGKYKI